MECRKSPPQNVACVHSVLSCCGPVVHFLDCVQETGLNSHRPTPITGHLCLCFFSPLQHVPAALWPPPFTSAAQLARAILAISPSPAAAAATAADACSAQAAPASSLQNVSFPSQFGKRRKITFDSALSNVQNQRTCSPRSSSRAQHRHSFLRLVTTSDLKITTKRSIPVHRGERRRTNR